MVITLTRRSDGIDGVYVGGQSGPRWYQHPMAPAWVEALAIQCARAGTPLFVKQGSGAREGRQYDLPDELWAIKQVPRWPAAPAPFDWWEPEP
jgi:protein gp37